jgi:hypothetical protein
LIIHFKLIDKSATKESMLKTFEIQKNGKVKEEDKITTGTYTTYTLDIKEVLLGSYNLKTMKVKMSGGCYDGICATSSLGYDYLLNKDGVIFLKHDKTNGNYFSYAAKFSAFKLDENKTLYRGNDQQTEKDNIKNSDKNYYLALDQLKEEIFLKKVNKRKSKIH